MSKSKKNSTWFQDGLRFECQNSGQCCTSRGEYGFVYLTPEDKKSMAKILGLKDSEFQKQYCASTDGALHLKENPGSPDCIFLEDNKCKVYKARPTQCRTWPFWPEHMTPRKWNKEVVKFCPGVNKGKLYSEKEIQKVLKEQADADESIWGNVLLGDS